MPVTYTANPGDSLCSIAYMHGFEDCQALRKEAANAPILNRAQDPAIPLPGEVVTVPDIVVREEDSPTDKRHNFVRRGRLASIRLVHGSVNKKVEDDDTLDVLNVSNYVTNKSGAPDGNSAFPGDGVRKFNSNANRDEDTFKVEVFDIRAAGDLQVELEVLQPTYDAAGNVTGYTQFPADVLAPRQLKATASKQGSTQRFRSCYLRLVSDGFDKQAAETQTLLVADLYDQGNKQVEILDQRVKASYKIPTCPANPPCRAMVVTPVGTDRRRLRITVQILRTAPGGAPIVQVADAERRILRWLRRMYAQMAISPKLMQDIKEVDPPANLVSISNETGRAARGDELMSFRIIAADGTTQIVGPYIPPAGDKPIATANALAGLIQAPFVATVTENAATFPQAISQRKSADIVITEASGQRVTISEEIGAAGRQTLTVGRPNPVLFQSWTGDNFLCGNIEQRTVLKNYDTGDDRVDLFVIDTFTDTNAASIRLGEAMMSGHRLDPRCAAIKEVKWSAFVDISSSNGTSDFPAVIAHEVMHVVGEVLHAENSKHQLMFPSADNDAGVATAKRVRDGNVFYASKPSGSFNLVQRMRSEGDPLLESW